MRDYVKHNGTLCKRNHDAMAVKKPYFGRRLMVLIKNLFHKKSPLHERALTD
jgi:hypothetical protein